MAPMIQKLRERFAELRADYGKIGFWAIYALGMPIVGLFFLGAAVIQTGPWFKTNQAGVFVFASAVGVFCGLAVFTTNIISSVAGWAFGFWTGVIVMLVGIAIAISINFFFARVLAAKKFAEVLESKPRIRAVYEALLKGEQSTTFSILILLRLSLTPFAGTNYLISAAGVSFPTYFWTTMVGYIPRTAIWVFLGTTIDKLTGDLPKDPRYLYFSIAVTIVVFIVISVLSKRALSKLVKVQEATI